jgi:hypothetical protein
MYSDLMGMIQEAIEDFQQQTGAKRARIVVVMNETTYNMLLDKTPKFLINNKKVKPSHIFGAEIFQNDRLPDESFMILHETCKDHIDEHIDELLEDEQMEVDMIPCDLCQHPLAMAMGIDGKIKCPWCGDVNDFDEIFRGEK